jgi:hypothetical protein
MVVAGVFAGGAVSLFGYTGTLLLCGAVTVCAALAFALGTAAHSGRPPPHSSRPSSPLGGPPPVPGGAAAEPPDGPPPLPRGAAAGPPGAHRPRTAHPTATRRPGHGEPWRSPRSEQ